MTKCEYKVVNFRQSTTHNNMFNFSLSMHGFLINGFTYVLPTEEGKKPAIMVPTGHRKRRVVRAFGITWKRLLNRLEPLVEGNRLVLEEHTKGGADENSDRI